MLMFLPTLDKFEEVFIQNTTNVSYKMPTGYRVQSLLNVYTNLIHDDNSEVFFLRVKLQKQFLLENVLHS